MRRKLSIFDWVLTAILTVICFSMLYPFVNTLFISLSEMKDIVRSNGMMLYPTSITWESYAYLFRYDSLMNAYRNTIFVTIIGTAIGMMVMTLGAFVLSHKRLPGHRLMTLFVLVTMFFGGGMIPNYINMKNLHLTNTLWSLILPFAINTWYMLLERNFISAIPNELHESAKIDGASEMTVLLKIILPLSAPILATITLFHSVGRWNEYAHAIIYNGKERYYVLQVIVRRLYAITAEAMDMDTLPPPSESVRASAIILTTLPIVCVYPFLQRYFTQGILIGSLKG